MNKSTIMGNEMKKRTKRQVKIPKYLPQQIVHHETRRVSSVENDCVEVVLLSSYPPRQCGIGTYSKDLQRALNNTFGASFKVNVYPLESGTSKFHYEEPVLGTLNTDHALDFLKAAYHINSDPNIGLVMVQHEFGLFRNNESSFLEFLEYLDKPVLLTFHTVLPEPSHALKKTVSHMASLVKGIVVMTHASAQILKKYYGVPEEKIKVIAHGTHLVEHANKGALKKKYGLQGKTVLSTFGLLGPGKSIETTLDALPNIVNDRPETVFLILGKTHPALAEKEGQAYRESLLQKVAQHGLEGHVRFVDAFLPLDTLLEYLQLTDIYLFTSKDPHQAVSGTFAYALSCGCPVVSTPIPHAVEVLKNGAGILFDFGDSRQLAQKVNALLDDPVTRTKMRQNGLQTTAASSWENAATAHAKLFADTLKITTPLKYKKPALNLKHIRKMTDHVGIIQFAKINAPDIESGYTLDDNARALIALCQHYELTGNASDLKYIKRYFDFVFRCFRHDDTFLNYVDKEQRFTEHNDTVNLEDACGRAVWALGYLLSMSRSLPDTYRYLEEKAQFVFEQAITAMLDAQSPRAIAFTIKGLYFYNHFEERECVNEKIKKLADRLISLYHSEAVGDWRWFESYLTYGNGVLPQALLMAYAMTLNPQYRKIAQESFDFLLSKIMVDGTLRVVSNKKWYHKKDPFDMEFVGGEQPIDVAYTVLALGFFHKIFPKDGYDTLMQDAFAWFLGKNPLHQTLYNPCTGGCYDGLERYNVNLNQGAESTLSYLLARMAIENLGD
ncbi:MAG TPA: glycosyltransferase [Pricia sp.]|nr:glycosyltransferase [Pricia sp.]